MWCGSCLSSTSNPTILCLTYSVPVSLPCCSTHRANWPQDLVPFFLLTRPQPYDLCPAHSILFRSLPNVTSTERFSLTQSGTPPPWPLITLSALTLLDFSSQHFQYWHVCLLIHSLVSSSTTGALGLHYPFSIIHRPLPGKEQDLNKYHSLTSSSYDKQGT